MRVWKKTIVSSAALAAWIAIIGSSWSCQNAFAFAFTKIPNALVDDRRAHHDRRNRRNRSTNHPKSSGMASSASIGAASQKEKTSSSALSLAQKNEDVEDSESNSNSNSIAQGRLLLGIVAVLYGSLNVSLRFVYDVPDIPPTAAALSATRGWLAFLCFLPPLFLDRRNSNTVPSSETSPETAEDKNTGALRFLPLLRSGLELAVWGFLAQGLLNVGLVSTGSARASFLTQTSVLFTPLISTSIGKQSVSKNVWLACSVALVGLVVLTMGAGAGGAAATAFSLSLSKGDLFVLGGALSWSMYLFRISFLGPKHPALVLQGVKTGLMAVLYSIWWMVTTSMNSGGGLLSVLNGFSVSSMSSAIPSWMASGWVVWIALFFSAIGPGTIADVLQQKGQKSVTPSEANILLSAEPVFATLFAVLLLGETSSLLEMIGGALILVAAVVASA